MKPENSSYWYRENFKNYIDLQNKHTDGFCFRVRGKKKEEVVVALQDWLNKDTIFPEMLKELKALRHYRYEVIANGVVIRIAGPTMFHRKGKERIKVAFPVGEPGGSQRNHLRAILVQRSRVGLKRSDREVGDIRVVRKFAWRPVYAMDQLGRRSTIWFRRYYQEQSYNTAGIGFLGDSIIAKGWRDTAFKFYIK